MTLFFVGAGVPGAGVPSWRGVRELLTVRPRTIPMNSSISSVFSVSGHHDLATPFRQTELDLARVGAQAGLVIRASPGGHMT